MGANPHRQHSGLNADDLHLALGNTRLRWSRDSKAAQAKPEQKSSTEMQLIELAFRMGKSSVDAGTFPRLTTPAFPQLALTDKDDDSTPASAKDLLGLRNVQQSHSMLFQCVLGKCRCLSWLVLWRDVACKARQVLPGDSGKSSGQSGRELLALPAPPSALVEEAESQEPITCPANMGGAMEAEAMEAEATALEGDPTVSSRKDNDGTSLLAAMSRLESALEGRKDSKASKDDKDGKGVQLRKRPACQLKEASMLAGSRAKSKAQKPAKTAAPKGQRPCQKKSEQAKKKEKKEGQFAALKKKHPKKGSAPKLVQTKKCVYSRAYHASMSFFGFLKPQESSLVSFSQTSH